MILIHWMQINKYQMLISEYIRRKDLLHNTTYIIKSTGEAFYILKGEEIAAKVFEKENELPISLFSFQNANENPKQNWLVT